MSGSWDAGSNSGSPDDGWDDPSQPRQDVRASAFPVVSNAPVHWLLAGIAAALLGVFIPAATDGLGLAALGWLLGGTVAILFLAVFVHVDLKRRSAGLARDSDLAPWLRRLLVVLAAAAVAANSWTMADAVARGNW